MLEKIRAAGCLRHCNAPVRHQARGHKPEGNSHDVWPAVERGRGTEGGSAKDDKVTRPHAVTYMQGQPFRFIIAAGLISDENCAMAFPGGLPKTD